MIRFNRVILTISLTFISLSLLIASNVSAQTCRFLFSKELKVSNYFSILGELRTELLDPQIGTAIMPVDIRSSFSQNWVNIISKTPFQKGSLILKSRFGEESIERNEVFKELLNPILVFADSFTEQLRNALTNPIERENLRLGRVVVFWSDGSQLQANSNRHIDRVEYLTGLFNLSGRGSLIEIPRSWENFRQMNTVQLNLAHESNFQTEEIKPFEGRVLSSSMRDFLLPGPGSFAIPHRAGIGTGGPQNNRLGFGLFWYLKGMEQALPLFQDSLELTQKIYTPSNGTYAEAKVGWELEKSKQDAETLRSKLFSDFGITQ